MCKFVQELQKLKKSSNESIDNEHSFSDFKKYMHVERQVQKDLETIIHQTKMQPKALVLVCGNVGDGKSHLISYLKNEKNLLNEFYIHNDATESFNRKQTEKEALAQVLSDFSDEQIGSDGESKVIVAINLGVLSNFIYSEEGERFLKLRHYVETCRVLIDDDSVASEDHNGVFFHVNFGDYHLYRLNDGKADSPYIKSIFSKIFLPSDENPFYQVYQSTCKNCPYSERCPVKTNYLMMQSDVVQDGVIRILIETIIKDKLIISTRELLNFIFDILVHPSVSAGTYKGKFGIDYLLPNLLYDHPELSDLLYYIARHDLLHDRQEEIDGIILEYMNSHMPVSLFEKYIANNACLSLIKKKLNANRKEKTGRYLPLLIRLIKIAPASEDTQSVNDEFRQFLTYLYASSRRDNKTVRELARMVETCVYKSTGSEDKNKIIIREISDEYSLSTALKIGMERFPANQAGHETIFDKFSEKIKLPFYVDSNGTRVKQNLYVDYELYEMLIKIHNGYRISAKESNYYAAFFSFVEKLTACSQYKTELTISKKNKSGTFKLTDERYEDEDHNYYFEEVD